MAEEIMKIEIIKREIIKPSSPTPSHLKTFKICLLDQLQTLVYGPILSFYPKNDITPEQRSQQLKKSLSESLVRYYPVAGVINNNTTIECNDEGAPYIEAQIKGLDLSTFLDQPVNPTALRQLVPAPIYSPEAGSWPLLLVQVTFFSCGGLAIGVSMSHKFADATTLGIFMKSWAQTASGSVQPIIPVLNPAAYFPPREILSDKGRPDDAAIDLKKFEGVTKRFVFDESKILDLKAKTACAGTRVEVVTALISKCEMAASQVSKPGGPTKLALAQLVNIRKRVDPPMPETLVGNMVGRFVAETNYKTEEPLTLRELVGLLRKGVREFREKKAKRVGSQCEEASEVILKDYRETGELFRRADTKVLVITSLCNFGLYEGLDFGWGKPIWVTIGGGSVYASCVILMDTREGNGVEAWVTLSKQDMALFERDPELLQFACTSTQNSSKSRL